MCVSVCVQRGHSDDSIKGLLISDESGPQEGRACSGKQGRHQTAGRKRTELRGGACWAGSAPSVIDRQRKMMPLGVVLIPFPSGRGVSE